MSGLPIEEINCSVTPPEKQIIPQLEPNVNLRTSYKKTRFECEQNTVDLDKTKKKKKLRHRNSENRNKELLEKTPRVKQSSLNHFDWKLNSPFVSGIFEDE